MQRPRPRVALHSVILSILAVVAGLVLLTFAADQFVLGGARLATSLNMSPIVIGAVVLGFGTSAPELLVSGIAASQGELSLGVGNVVGSNAANLSLVLGAAALISPLPLPAKAISREAPLAFAAAGLFAILVQGGLSRFEGITMLVLLVAAIGWLLMSGEADDVEIDEEFLEDETSTSYEIGRTLVGLVGTIGGAQLLVEGATWIADDLGLTGGFVGLTLVAIGTSLPELVTAVAAARRNETELIVGNLLGSNLFNSLAVGGVIAVIGPGAVGDNSVAVNGVILMMIISAAAIAFMYTQRLVVRWEAAVLLVLYVLTIAVVGAG